MSESENEKHQQETMRRDRDRMLLKLCDSEPVASPQLTRPAGWLGKVMLDAEKHTEAIDDFRAAQPAAGMTPQAEQSRCPTCFSTDKEIRGAVSCGRCGRECKDCEDSWHRAVAPVETPAVKQYRPLSECRRAFAETIVQVLWNGKPDSRTDTWEKRVQWVAGFFESYELPVRAEGAASRPVAPVETPQRSFQVASETMTPIELLKTIKELGRVTMATEDGRDLILEAINEVLTHQRESNTDFDARLGIKSTAPEQTRLTAEQFYDAHREFEHVPTLARKHFFEFAEAFRDKSEAELLEQNKRLNSARVELKLELLEAVRLVAGLREEIERLKRSRNRAADLLLEIVSIASDGNTKSGPIPPMVQKLKERAEAAEAEVAALRERATDLIKRLDLIMTWADSHFSKDLPIELNPWLDDLRKALSDLQKH